MLRSLLCCGGSEKSGLTETSLESPQHFILADARIRRPDFRRRQALPIASSVSPPFLSGQPVAGHAPGFPKCQSYPGLHRDHDFSRESERVEEPYVMERGSRRFGQLSDQLTAT